MSLRFRGLPALALLSVTSLTALVACAPQEDAAGPAATTSPSATQSADACAKESLQTKSAGTLTIATDKPAYAPWFVDDDPANGKGFEGAVAAAVAEQLGFSADEVTWVSTRFDAAIAPGPKNFDFDINQFSITEERKKAVDFSSPYYDVSQAVIAVKGTDGAKAASLADLKGLKIGAQVGTTSYDAIVSTIQPSSKPAVYNTNDDAKKALENGQIDAMVTDLPTAFYISGVELDGGVIVGQLEQSGGTPEQFALVLDKGSPLTTCVSAAVAALRQDGTLDQIEQEWLADVAGAPVLK